MRRPGFGVVLRQRDGEGLEPVVPVGVSPPVGMLEPGLVVARRERCEWRRALWRVLVVPVPSDEVLVPTEPDPAEPDPMEPDPMEPAPGVAPVVPVYGEAARGVVVEYGTVLAGGCGTVDVVCANAGAVPAAITRAAIARAARRIERRMKNSW